MGAGGSARSRGTTPDETGHMPGSAENDSDLDDYLNIVEDDEPLDLNDLEEPYEDDQDLDPETTGPGPNEDQQTKLVKMDVFIQSNRDDHNTWEYDRKALIVRRGQTFDIMLEINKHWYRKTDIIRLQFALGTKPRISRRTMFFITPGRHHDLHEACAIITNIENHDTGSRIVLSVNLPSDSVIGYFKFHVVVKKKDDTKFTKYRFKDDVIVLFNPWVREDAVYVENDAERYEYVMNQTGRLYSGKSTKICSRPWIFGQFEENIIDVALSLLYNNKYMTWEGYGDPVQVTRCISAMVNSDDDDGVLMGNWNGDYSEGASPFKWTGSVSILQEYFRSKTPVKFGQCWVFSGITTTVCRALGLPTRSVTNFNSVHDNDYNIAVDMFYDVSGKSLKHLNDSIWSFHVWNEAWFRRDDIPGSYGGWQAFDSTPQEISDGYYRCGPTPVTAIREGSVHLGYDTRFVFSEVNGDLVKWVQEPDGTQVPTKISSHCIGKSIITKQVNSNDEINDITYEYKYEEGSAEEQSAVSRAFQNSYRHDKINAMCNTNNGDDVEMAFTAMMSPDATASFVFKAGNTSDKIRTVVATFTAVPTYYTGTSGDDLKRDVKIIPLKPGREREYKFEIAAADWINQVAADAALGMYVMARVRETKQYFTWNDAEDDGLELEKPELEMQVERPTAKLGEELKLTINFTNPLDLPLEQCILTVDGTGIQAETDITVDDVEPKAEMTKEITLTTNKVGVREVVAAFLCKQLVNIIGAVELEVVEQGEEENQEENHIEEQDGKQEDQDKKQEENQNHEQNDNQEENQEEQREKDSEGTKKKKKKKGKNKKKKESENLNE